MPVFSLTLIQNFSIYIYMYLAVINTKGINNGIFVATIFIISQYRQISVYRILLKEKLNVWDEKIMGIQSASQIKGGNNICKCLHKLFKHSIKQHSNWNITRPSKDSVPADIIKHSEIFLEIFQAYKIQTRSICIIKKDDGL